MKEVKDLSEHTGGQDFHINWGFCNVTYFYTDEVFYRIARRYINEPLSNYAIENHTSDVIFIGLQSAGKIPDCNFFYYFVLSIQNSGCKSPFKGLSMRSEPDSLGRNRSCLYRCQYFSN